MDLDQETPLNPADHTTLQWKTMDFPLIALVGANFAYSCKSLHASWSSCSADLLSQFHRVQFRQTTMPNIEVRSKEKHTRKNYWACFKIDSNYFRYYKDLLYFCLKFNRRGNQICSSMLSSFPFPWPFRTFFEPLGATFLVLSCKHLLCCSSAKNLTLWK